MTAMATLGDGQARPDGTRSRGSATARAVRGVDTKVLDIMLSDELSKLSIKDREALQEQIHGITNGLSSSVQETPELLEGALNLMAYELDFFIKPNNKRSYIEAITQYPDTTCVRSNDFRLRFLRCEQFDVKKAAERMCRYLDLVNDVFGPELLERPVMLKDVTTNAEEIELIRSGIYSLLPSKDRAGRRIFCSVGNLSLTYSLLVRVKLSIYMFWIATEDVEAQTNGLVIVMWPSPDCFSLKVNETSGGGGHLDSFDIEKDKEKAEKYFQSEVEGDEDKSVRSTGFSSVTGSKLHFVAAKLFSSLPVRVVGHHCCGFPDTPIFELVKGLVVLGLGKQRSTVRFHSGKSTEISYKLLSYGIPAELVPMTDTGNVKNKNQLHWMTVRKLLEDPKISVAGELAAVPIEVPLSRDVLFRFGQSYPSHRGNIEYREIVSGRYDRHKSASNNEKLAITWEIVEEVERHGRFLTWDRKKNYWIQIDDRETKRSKVATSFKEHGRRLRAQANLQTSESCSKSIGPAWKKQKCDGGLSNCIRP